MNTCQMRHAVRCTDPNNVSHPQAGARRREIVGTLRQAGLALLFAVSCAAGAAVVTPVTQSYNGDIIQMNIDPQGRPEINVKPSTHAAPGDPYVRTYYCGSCWGNTIFLEGGSGGRYTSGYISGTLLTPVSNDTVAVPGGTSIVTVTDLGSSGIRLTQTFTHLTGTRYVSKDWVLQNVGPTTHTDVRFLHGGDTYFGNNDFAYGFYDPANSMVFIRNLDTADWGIMGFYANPATPADHYFEGYYGTGYSLASSGLLPDSINASYVDASYQLQWNRATFAPGATWSISATEVWTPASDLQVLAPTSQNVGAGTTATLSFTVQNLSNSTPLTVNLAASSSVPGWSASVTGGSTHTIATNASRSVTVSVNVPANATGSSVISLSAVSGSLSSIASATLTSTALNLLVNPGSIDFGTLAPGASASQSVTVSNNGGSSVTLGTLATTAPFSKSNDTCSGHTLYSGEGGPCTFTVTFSPTANGNSNAVLNIPVTSPVLATRSIALTGVAATVVPNTPVLTITPATLAFGALPVGTSSAPNQAVLTNSGTAALSIGRIYGTGDFGFSSNCPLAPATLSTGGSCSVFVTFSPLSTGSQASFIYLESNAGNGSTLSIPVSGQGLIVPRPGINVTPSSLAFTDRVVGTISDPQALIVTNTGTANLTLSGVTVTGSGYQRIVATPASADCGAVVAPLASCQIALIFAPSVVGAAHGSVTINHNADGGSVSVALSGNGMPRPQALISFSANLVFADQIIGTTSASQAVTLRNSGTLALNISAVGLTGANAAEFALAGNCNVSLAPGASCGLTVVFKPVTVGTKSAQLSVASNAQNDVVNPPTLGGNGVPVPVPIVRLSATTLGFGNVIYGGSPAGQAVTLSNVGTAPLVINGIDLSGNSDFTQTNNCGSGVAAAGQCSLAIRFAPHALGTRSGTLSIRSNAAGSPHQVQLGGTGCRYFSPAAARFFLTGC